MTLKAFYFLIILGFIFSPVDSRAQEIHLNDQTYLLLQKIAAEPQNLEAKMDLAYLFSEGREYDRAIKLYEEVLTQQSANHRALNELCYLYTFVREQDKAIEACQKLTQNFANSYLSFDNLGLSYYKFGDTLKALQTFKKALELAPNSWVVKYHIGQSLLALKDFELAKDYFSKALEGSFESPDDQAIFYYGLYEAERELKDYKAAYAAILKTYRLSQNPLYLGRVIKTYMKWHEVWFFFGIGFCVLMMSQYLGKRLNRFLRNED